MWLMAKYKAQKSTWLYKHKSAAVANCGMLNILFFIDVYKTLCLSFIRAVGCKTELLVYEFKEVIFQLFLPQT